MHLAMCVASLGTIRLSKKRREIPRGAPYFERMNVSFSFFLFLSCLVFFFLLRPPFLAQFPRTRNRVHCNDVLLLFRYTIIQNELCLMLAHIAYGPSRKVKVLCAVVQYGLGAFATL